jgi:hypothetical protein
VHISVSRRQAVESSTDLKGETGQYRINQIVFETAFMYRGLSRQDESYPEKIKDTKNNQFLFIPDVYIFEPVITPQGKI